MTALEKLKADYERNNKIKVELDEGKTLKEIADKYGVSIGLPNYLKKNFEEVQNSLLERINKYEWVIKLFKEGYTINQVADLEDMTKQNVSRILRMNDIDRKSGGKSKRRLENIKKIKELTKKGHTLEEIEEFTGLDEMKIRQYANREGIDLKTNTSVRVSKLTNKVVELRDKYNMSQVEISEKLNRSQAYVSKILLAEDRGVRLPREEYEKRDNLIFKDFNKGLSVKELATKYDLGELNVRRILYKFTKE